MWRVGRLSSARTTLGAKPGLSTSNASVATHPARTKRNAARRSCFVCKPLQLSRLTIIAHEIRAEKSSDGRTLTSSYFPPPPRPPRPPFPRPSPQQPSEAPPYPILSGMSRPRCAALRRAVNRCGGQPGWRGENAFCFFYPRRRIGSGAGGLLFENRFLLQTFHAHAFGRNQDEADNQDREKINAVQDKRKGESWTLRHGKKP